MKTISKIESGTITSPNGFMASGITAGLKKSGNADMALVFSKTPAITTGAFTSNLFPAAPVILCRKILKKSKTTRAIIVNSGNANACTGDQGYKNAAAMAKKTASALKIKSPDVLVASTGRIGVQMPMDIINSGIEKAVSALSDKAGHDAALAIMTTDTKPKEAAFSFEINGKTITVAGMVKGAGMICPEVKAVPHATMLAFITTDACVSHKFLCGAMSKAIDLSFNRISVDNDMSTNDSVFVMANGAAENKRLKGSCKYSELFEEALTQVMVSLAKQMVLDGEGVTKFVKIDVLNARSEKDARLCARAIANSMLCKTAWFGKDPNWGRIVAAAGYSGAEFKQEKVNVWYDDKPVVLNGGDAGTKEDDLAEILKKHEFTITVELNSGKKSYYMWTGDISYDYVKINADYHT